jgi:cytochrome c556
MKSTPLFTATLLFLAVSAFTVRADTAMEVSMKKMSDAAKQLGTDLKLTDDTKHNKDADLKCVATIQTESTTARGFVPKKAKTLPADQQQAFVADFQKDMDMFLKDVDALNTDITAENWTAARTDFQKMIDDEKSGHKKFRIKKD